MLGNNVKLMPFYQCEKLEPLDPEMLLPRKGLWNVVRDVGHSRGEEKHECVT